MSRKSLSDQAEELARVSDRHGKNWHERVADVMLIIFIGILSVTAVYGLLSPVVP